MLPAHSGQTQRCAQGSKRMRAFASMQMTHMFVFPTSVCEEKPPHSSFFSKLKKRKNQ